MGLRSNRPPQLRTGAQNEPSQLAASVEKKWKLGPNYSPKHAIFFHQTTWVQMQIAYLQLQS